MSERFPNNNNFGARSAESKPARTRKSVEPEDGTKVISGIAKRVKKPVGQKFLDTFVQGDIVDVFDHLLRDILIPSAIETLGDMGHNLVDGMIYGDEAPARSRRRRNLSSREVTSIDRGTGRSRGSQSLRNRRSLNFDDIWLETRDEAVSVLDELYDRLDRYDRVTVADLYGAVGWDHDYTERKYGWYELDGAKVIPVRGPDGPGWSLDLPRPEFLG